MKNIAKNLRLSALILAFVLIVSACGNSVVAPQQGEKYEAYVELNGNVPEFTESEIKAKSFEKYSRLDYLGRCGVATACIGRDIMPTEERGAIGQVKPSGWQIAKYDIVDGKYLYNRCHLIGYQLTGENANERNLITGTRSMNVDGMLPFENMVAEYVESTGNHVMYRVTPVFEGSDLVAKGVKMEALSVEDGGAGISFNVFVYNAQPGIAINYADGTSKLNEESGEKLNYILNTNTKKFHYPDCSSVSDIKEKSKENYNGTRAGLLNRGYAPCGRCNP